MSRPLDPMDGSVPVPARDEPTTADSTYSLTQPLSVRQRRHADMQLRLEDEIGRGGMGVVYRGHDVELNREVAVKVLLAEHASNLNLVRRFFEEAQVAGGLQHPGVMPVYELGYLSDGRPYFAMKLIQGRTLAHLLAERDVGHVSNVADAEEARCKRAPQDRPHLLKVFEQICQALAYAHSRGVLHRDIKPSNVMVGAFGEVHVTDWGLAKRLDIADRRLQNKEETPGAVSPSASHAQSAICDRQSSLTEAGVVLGTPSYMAPEQARGEIERIDARSDVFGLGAILCEILTGTPPFVGGSRGQRQRRAANAELEEAFARLTGCDADRELVALAKRCLAPEPEGRPADAGKLAGELTAYLESVEARLRRAELEQARAQVKMAEERKRRKVQLALAVLLLILLGAGGTGAWWWQQRRQTADAAVTRALDEARRMHEQARETPLGDAGRFHEALAAARQAKELAQAGGASSSARRQAEELVELLDAEEKAALRDRKLLAALLEIHAPREGPRFQKDERGVQELTAPLADEQFAAAFQEWGLDVDNTPAAEAAARLRARPAAFVAEVVAALDEWAAERQRQRNPIAARQPAALAEALDESAGKRHSLSAMLARGQLETERALAVLALALRPVPIPFDGGLGNDRSRLRKLAAQTDVATEPVLGLLTLVRALRAAGDDAIAEDVLRAAVRARPGEVVLHNALGRLLSDQRRWREAVESYAVVRALRPELGVRLAETLIVSGKSREGLALFERLLLERPDNPWLHFVHGLALYYIGRYEESVAANREAIRLNPRLATAYGNLGISLNLLGRFREAEDALDAALRLQPRLFRLHVTRSNSLISQRRFQEAESACREAIRFQAFNPVAYNNLAVSLRGQRRFKEAEEACQVAIHQDPHYYLGYLNLGIALNGQRRWQESEAACHQAIRLQPEEYRAYTYLGRALTAQRRHREAESAYRECLRLRPDIAAEHYSLGNVLNVQRRLQEAEAAYRRSILLDKNFAPAHNNLGNVLASQGRHKEAEAEFREALRLKVDYHETYNNLAGTLLELRRLEEAEPACRECLRLVPGYALAYNTLGNILKERDRFEEAESAYRKAIELLPAFPQVYYNLGNMLILRRRYAEAETLLREALRLRHDPPRTYFRLGLALFRQEKNKEAESAFRESIRLAPRQIPAYHLLGDVLNGQGRHEEAAAAFRQLIQIQPNFAQAHLKLGNTLNRLNLPAQAEATYREAIRLQPDFADAHCNLGMVLQIQGRFAEGLEALRRGDALGRKSPDWPYRSDVWVARAERFVALDRRLPEVLAGDEPRSPGEGMELASLCRHPTKRMHRTSARLAAAAFAAEPKLAAGFAEQYRYHAARSAALAAAGQAADAQRLPDRVVFALRRDALMWLRGELAFYVEQVKHGGPKLKDAVWQRLASWQKVPDLTSVREKEALDRLDAAERAAWQQFWEEVEGLRKQTAGKK
jgi:serine/threonine-protein kinase